MEWTDGGIKNEGMVGWTHGRCRDTLAAPGNTWVARCDSSSFTPLSREMSAELHSPAPPPAPYTRMYKTIIVVVHCMSVHVTVLSYFTRKDTS